MAVPADLSPSMARSLISRAASSPSLSSLPMPFPAAANSLNAALPVSRALSPNAFTLATVERTA